MEVRGTVAIPLGTSATRRLPVSARCVRPVTFGVSPSRTAGGACKEKVAWYLNALNAQRHLAESGQLALGTSGSLLGSCGGFLFPVASAILKPTPWEEGIQCVTIPWHTFPTAWP